MPPTARPRPSARRLLVTCVAGCAAAAALAGGPVDAAPGSVRATWDWPVARPVTVVEPFAAPVSPYGPGHRGVDLAAALGSSVRAAGGGTVVVAGSVAGRPVVVVAHGPVRSADELRTTYQPVEAAVRVGARVETGAVLGSLSRWDGHCAATCLHWGLRRGDAYLDPTSLLQGPVRLLPHGPPIPHGPPTTSHTRLAAAADLPASTPPDDSPAVKAASDAPPDRSWSRALVLAGSAGAVVAAGAPIRRRRTRPSWPRRSRPGSSS